MSEIPNGVPPDDVPVSSATVLVATISCLLLVRLCCYVPEPVRVPVSSSGTVSHTPASADLWIFGPSGRLHPAVSGLTRVVACSGAVVVVFTVVAVPRSTIPVMSEGLGVPIWVGFGFSDGPVVAESPATATVAAASPSVISWDLCPWVSEWAEDGVKSIWESTDGL